MYSVDGRINKESAEAVRAVVRARLPDIDVLGTFTNGFLP